MADLSQGQSASVVLGAGETVRVTASGTTTVRGAYGAPSSTTTLTANFQDFGPYGVPAKLEVVAVSGGCSYVTVQGQAVTLTPSQVAAGLTGWTGTAPENAALRAVAQTRSMSGWTGYLPSVMSSPPTLTAGTANASTAIASSVLVTAMREDCFSIFGGPRNRRANYPNYLGIQGGTYPQISSPSPYSVEFDFTTSDSTGRFEIYTKGDAITLRVLVLDAFGRWKYASSGASFTHAADGSLYLDLVTLGAAGTYGIRIEFSGGAYFFGIRCGATDTVRARAIPAERVIVVGDSFTEPTFSEAGSYINSDGWVQLLYYLTGWDVWSAGSGGTGYLNPGSGRVKFRDRLANDVLAFSPTKIIWAGGINDTSYTAAALQAEALACYQQCTLVLPLCEQIVLDLFWPRGITGLAANVLQFSDALRNAAASAGVRFVPLQQQPIPEYLRRYGDAAYASTLAAGAITSATSLSVVDIPAYFKQAGVGSDQWWVKVGSGASQVVRRVSTISGTGPYTVGLANSIGTAFSAGEVVSLGAESYITGTGKQGSTAGDGNADVMTGADGTHPTKLGHSHLARVVTSALARSYTGR